MVAWLPNRLMFEICLCQALFPLYYLNSSSFIEQTIMRYQPLSLSHPHLTLFSVKRKSQSWFWHKIRDLCEYNDSTC